MCALVRMSVTTSATTSHAAAAAAATPLLRSQQPPLPRTPNTPNTQRKRGPSFLAHCLNPNYMNAAQAAALQLGHGSNDTDGDNNGSASPGGASDVAFRRSPTLSRTNEFLIPAKAASLGDCLTVVLDLDETLVYARSGPLYVRPGCEALMAFLAANCETVVWTSSMHHYADAVVAQIDSAAAIHHVVYRHPRWCKTSSSTKDLRLLGRDLDKTIIIENTPDCVVGYEANGVLVGEYDGGELEDKTLTNLLELLTDLVQQHKQHGVTVPAYIASSARVQWRELPSDTGAFVGCYCLHAPELDPSPSPSLLRLAMGAGVCAHYTSPHHCTHQHRCHCPHCTARRHSRRRRHESTARGGGGGSSNDSHNNNNNSSSSNSSNSECTTIACAATATTSSSSSSSSSSGNNVECGNSHGDDHKSSSDGSTAPCCCAWSPYGAAAAAVPAKRCRLQRVHAGRGEYAMTMCRRPQPLKKVLIC